MSPTTCMSLFAGAACTLASAGVASANFETVSSADEVRAIVAEMMADADSRSSLLQSGGSGHDGSGFKLRSADGAFELQAGGDIRVRYFSNFRDADDDQNDNEGGFDINPRFWVKGKIHGNLGYQLLFNGKGGDLAVDDAFITYEYDNGWKVRGGQFKPMHFLEQYNSDNVQLAVERSITGRVFSPGRTQGLEVSYSADDWRLFLGFNDGFRSSNSEFNTPRGGNTQGVDPVTGDFIPGTLRISGGGAQYGLDARVEWKGSGTWKQFKQFTSMPGADAGLLIGAGVHYEGGNDDNNAFAGGDYDLFTWAIDAAYQADGWNLYGAFLGTAVNVDDVPVGPAPGVSDDQDATDMGFILQGGYFIPDTDWELFARYDVVLPDSDRAGDDNFQTITVGTNYYLHGQAAKFTLDVQWNLDEASDTELVGTDADLGFLGDDDTGEFAIRGQFQLIF